MQDTVVLENDVPHIFAVSPIKTHQKYFNSINTTDTQGLK